MSSYLLKFMPYCFSKLLFLANHVPVCRYIKYIFFVCASASPTLCIGPTFYIFCRKIKLVKMVVSIEWNFLCQVSSDASLSDFSSYVYLVNIIYMLIMQVQEAEVESLGVDD